jgi:Mg-chelatase subunit ChlD
MSKPTTHKVFNLIILDESGSMESIKQTIITGFNEVVQTVKGVAEQYPEQEHYISLISFNGLGIKTIHANEPVSQLHAIDDKKYQPDASTPLYDAMGAGLAMQRREAEQHSACNVLVTILTDGEENASKEYQAESIRKMIEELQLKNWTFTYIGANHDVTKVAASLSITNTMQFEANESSVQQMFAKEKRARMAYSKKISKQQDTSSGFYDEEA